MSKKQYVQISVPKEVLEKIDLSREKTLLTRSSWFLKAALKQLEEEVFSRPEKRIEL